MEDPRKFNKHSWRTYCGGAIKRVLEDDRATLFFGAVIEYWAIDEATGFWTLRQRIR